MRRSVSRAVPLRLALLAGALGLTIEFLLGVFRDASLCSAESCKLVEQSLRFQADSLVLLGAVFFWASLILTFLAERRNSEAVWQLILAILLAGLAFEGALLGYQLSGFEAVCWLCLTVAGLLLASGIALAWRRRSVLIVGLCLCVGLAAVTAPSLLRFEPTEVSLPETDFLERPSSQDGPNPELTLFFSLHCSHCSEVFANLALNRPWSAHWHFASIDTGRADLARLAAAVRAADSGASNVFLELLRVKQAEPEGFGGPVPQGLEQSVRRAKAFFKSRGYTGIPLLIAQEGPGRRISLTGSQAIGKYLWENGLVRSWLSGSELEERFKR